MGSALVLLIDKCKFLGISRDTACKMSPRGSMSSKKWTASRKEGGRKERGKGGRKGDRSYA